MIASIFEILIDIEAIDNEFLNAMKSLLSKVNYLKSRMDEAINWITTETVSKWTTIQSEMNSIPTLQINYSQ